MKVGSIVAVITKYTGIHWIVKKISNLLGKDCGCDERKERWDQKFSRK